MWTIIISLILVSYLENIPYQKDHNGNKQDLSAFCAILGYIYRWSRIKTSYLHISDFHYIFINHKFIPFAITHRISKCLKHIIRKLIKLRYVRT